MNALGSARHRRIGYRLVLVSVLLVPTLVTVSGLAACGGTPAPQVATVPVEVTRIVEMEGRELMATAPAPMTSEAPTAHPASVALPGDVTAARAVSRARAERMIIKNAEMELLVQDTDTALDGVTVIAADYGGYIISSHSWLEADYKYATVRLGVPAEEFENVLRRLRSLALEVENELASGEDVTDQYVDLQSRLTNLQATRDRIREFLDKAATVEEALKVNEQLSQVEGQIEEIQGRMNYLKDRAAYSTIDVALDPLIPTPTPSPTPTVTPTPTATPRPTAVPWKPGETLWDAADLLNGIGRALVTALIWIAVVLGPFVLAGALVAWLVVRSRRKSGRRPPPNKEE